MGSSMVTRVRRMWISRSVKMRRRGKKELCGFLNESGRNTPSTRPLARVKPPMMTKSQNQPGWPPTPRMCRMP